MQFYYGNIVSNIFFASGYMPQKTSSMCKHEKKNKDAYRDHSIDLGLLLFSYFTENREKNAMNMKEKIATRIKQRNCEDAVKKFKYVKNGDSRERRKENIRDVIAALVSFHVM